MRIATFISRLIALWAMLEGCWFCYTDSLRIREVLAGGIASGVATVALLVMIRQGGIRFRFTLRDAGASLVVCWPVVSGTAQLLARLTAQMLGRSKLESRVAEIPFDAVGDAPEIVGRRALVTAYNSLTPNSVVIGPVQEQKRLLYHEIFPAKMLTLEPHPGARA
jgi:multisubunit Na+/H+ antiporter MnhE subunit